MLQSPFIMFLMLVIWKMHLQHDIVQYLFIGIASLIMTG